jgi:hypothetical protein
MRRLSATGGLCVLGLLALCAPARAAAQSTMLRVISSDSVPIPYAWISVEGGAATIADERGETSLGGGRHQTLTVEVRRIGFGPWFGKLEIPDSATVLTVMLPRIVQKLAKVQVTGTQTKSRLELAGFYDRLLMRQKGALSATFIGPEEIEKRHVSQPSDLLHSVNGVSMFRSDHGGVFLRGTGGACFMTVMVDGRTLCPPVGCHVLSGNGFGIGPAPKMRGAVAGDTTVDNLQVNINQYVNPNDIAGIEVYARGANMPISLQASDNSCGVVAIWTGSKK